MHVTLRSRVAPLRSRVFPAIALAVAGTNARDPRAFRVLHCSVELDQVHFIVEAKDAVALSSGVRSLAIRIARCVNERLARTGPLWQGRYLSRALTTQREVRDALRQVLARRTK